MHDQPGMSLRVQRRLPDFRPEPVPEGVLSALTAFPVHVEIVVAQRPHDPSTEPVRLTGEAMDELEDLLQMSSMAHVSGEHESPLRRGPVVARIDETERTKNLLQRLQLAVNVPDDAHPLRAVLEKLRHIAMRGESRLDRHVLHDDVLHLKDVEFIGREAQDEATASEILTGADVHLPGEEVAKVVVDRRVVLDVHFRREAHPAPMLHQSRHVVRYVRDQHEWPILIDLQGRAKLGERLLVVHPQDRKRAVVDRVGCHPFEDGTEQSAERVLEERTELGMKDGVDVVGSSLPPCSFEEPDTEGPVFLIDPAGSDVELSHDLGGFVGALLRRCRARP